MAEGEKGKKQDIKPGGTECINWDSTDPVQSLKDLRTYVEDEAQKSANWYWREKDGKKKPSQIIQFLALVLTASAGLVPIAIQVIKNVDPNLLKNFDSGPVASLLVGSAAALLGLDKAFGYSSGWTRYVLTGTSMTRLLQEFRLDWVAIYAGAKEVPPTLEQQAKLILRAKTFVSDVQGLVLQETKDWVSEFQSNTAQMEKDVKTQLDTLKAQVEKIAKEREAATVPGAIELTVPNADKTDGPRFDVVLENKAGSVSSAAANTKMWTQINTAPGQYKITIDAKVKGVPVSTSAILEVKPAETKQLSISLPIAG